MEDRSDAALVSDALAGDREAFAVLVRRYQDYAYGVAIGLLSDFDLARDVVQEAFLSAYGSLHKLREPAKFGAWLRGIVRNMARRAARERRRVHALAERIREEAGSPRPLPCPLESAEIAERRQIVREALESLDEPQREAVSLFYVDGLSYDDIAGFLGVSRTAVKGRLQRGRGRLKEKLKMVEATFSEQELPRDFPAEVRRLLTAAVGRGDTQRDAMDRLAGLGGEAVDPLLEALEDPRDAIRRVAAMALCRIGDPRALTPFLRSLYTEAHRGSSWQSAVIRRGAVLSIPGMREAMLDHVRERRADGFWVAMRALCPAKGDEEVFQVVYDAFRDHERLPGKWRIFALETLCVICPDRALDLVVQALNDPDPVLRGRACRFASSRGILPPLKLCLQALGRSIMWYDRLIAARLVMRHGDEGRRELQGLVRTGVGAPRATAVVALAETGDPGAVEALLDELVETPRDRNWHKVLRRVAAARSAPKLLDRLDSGVLSVEEVATVLWALVRRRSDAAGPLLDAMFREGVPSARAAAARILGRRDGAEFIPELRRALREGKPRKPAQEAFRRMLKLGDAAVPAAREMLQSEHWPERKAAVCLLRRWGKLAPEEKERAREDEHVAVRHAAEWKPRGPK